MNWTIYNGSIVKEEDVSLDINNRAFLYGDGFFETIRIVNGKPLFISDHVERISKALEILKIDAPFTLDNNTLYDLITEICRLNNIDEGGRARLTIFRHANGFYTPDRNQAGYLLVCNALETNLFQLNKKGLHLGIFNQHLKPVLPLYSIKSINALLFVLAGVYAKKNNFDDCLIINEFENVVEAISSNVFVIQGNTIITPGLDEGCIHGIMRKNIFKILERETSYNIKIKNLLPEELENADEIFLTNTITGIQWVVAFKSKRYFNKNSKELIELLNNFILKDNNN